MSIQIFKVLKMLQKYSIRIQIFLLKTKTFLLKMLQKSVRVKKERLN